MSARQDRLDELLAQQVTAGLTPVQTAELDLLLVDFPAANAERFAYAAAAIHIAALPRLEPCPERLRAKLEVDAQAFLASKRSQPARKPARGITPWPWLAVAASLLLAITAWWPDAPSGAASLAEQRAALIESGAMPFPWSATEDPNAVGAAGDVVWSDSAQTGFMRIEMLASNEPARLQYQLWIFDEQRDERYPVDGGVFDVPDGVREIIVPIEPKLRVGHAVLFAVTVEQPGGVVVSSRERIVLLAELG